MVGLRVVLTNAHCVLDAETGQVEEESLIFRAGLDGARARASSRVKRAWLGTLDPSKHRGRDWALLLLEKPLGATVGWLEVDASLHFGRVSLIGYALDFEKGRVPFVDTACDLLGRREARGYLRHDCDINVGASGAPLLSSDGGEAKVVAVNAAHMVARPFVAPFDDARANIAVESSRFLSTLSHLQGCFRTVASTSDAEVPPLADATASGLCMM